MFLLTTAFALSFLGRFANAQPIGYTAMGITAIEDHFQSADLVPGLLPSFNPSALMTVTFPGVGPISPGQNLSRQETARAPDVTITPANSSVSTTGNFTLMMVDAYFVGTNESNRQVLHWLANSATLQNDSSPCPSLNVSTDGGLVVTGYNSPAPPANLSSPIVGIDLYFYLTDYISSSNLGQPIAGMFFGVQSPTSAVVTSTLTTSVSSSPTAIRRARETV